MLARTVLAAGLVAGLLSGASPPRLAGDFQCPEAGGPAWREVKTAHFTVQTDLFSAKVVRIDTLEVLHGALPRRALARAFEWAALHREELQVDWDRARNRQVLAPIDPLD